MTQIQAILTTAFFQCLSKTLGTPILPKWFKQSSFCCEPFCFLKSAKSLCTSWYLPAHSCIQLSIYIYIYLCAQMHTEATFISPQTWQEKPSELYFWGCSFMYYQLLLMGLWEDTQSLPPNSTGWEYHCT